MRKVSLLLLLAMIFVSCGASKIVDEAETVMNGDWMLNEISFPGDEEDLEVTLLNNVPARCLEGSTWNFISNNHTGSYNPAGLTCENSPQFFIWNIKEMDQAAGQYDLLLKPTDADFDSQMGNAGYRLDLTNVAGDMMVWEQTIIFEGEPFTIRMIFNKI